jgi:hypothetical protein
MQKRRPTLHIIDNASRETLHVDNDVMACHKGCDGTVFVDPMVSRHVTKATDLSRRAVR